MEFYVSSKGQTIGPFEKDQLPDLLSKEKIREGDFLWSPELKNWTAVSKKLLFELGIEFEAGSKSSIRVYSNYWAAIELGWWDKLLDEIINADCLEALGDLTFLNSLKSKAKSLFKKATDDEVDESPSAFLIKEYNILDKSAEACETDIITLVRSFVELEQLQDYFISDKPFNLEKNLISLQKSIAIRIRKFRDLNSIRLHSDGIIKVWNLAADNFGQSEDLPLIFDLNREILNLDKIGGCFAHMLSEKLCKLDSFFLALGLCLQSSEKFNSQIYGNLTRIQSILEQWNIPQKWITDLLLPFEEKIKKLTDFNLPIKNSEYEVLKKICVFDSEKLNVPGVLICRNVKNLPTYKYSQSNPHFMIRKKRSARLSLGWVLAQDGWRDFGVNYRDVKILESKLSKAKSSLKHLVNREKTLDILYEKKIDFGVKAFKEKLQKLSNFIKLSKQLDVYCYEFRYLRFKSRLFDFFVTVLMLLFVGGILGWGFINSN